VIGLCALAAVVVWLVWFSSVLSVRDVRVVGVTDERAAEVLSAAAVPTGVPLARLVFELDQVLPRKLPKIRAEGAALEAAVAVLQSLPDDIRDRVVTVVATTRDDVDLLLRSGDEVRWGNASQPEMKAEVLRALLKRKADMYDVSAPELPTTFRLG